METENKPTLEQIKLDYIARRCREYDSGSITAEKCIDLIVGMLCVGTRPLTDEEKAYALTIGKE